VCESYFSKIVTTSKWFWLFGSGMSEGPVEGEEMLVQLEFGPPNFDVAIPERARRSIDATLENLEYEKGDHVDKVIVEGKLEVTDVYRKDL